MYKLLADLPKSQTYTDIIIVRFCDNVKAKTEQSEHNTDFPGVVAANQTLA